MGIKYVFNPFTENLDVIDETTALWNRAGTVLSPKTAGDDIKVNGVTILDDAPILVFQDSNGAGAASTGFIEWRDSGGGRAGYFGNASSGDDDLSWGNEQGGHIKIITTGAGELQVSAPLNMNTNKIVGVVDPTTNQEAATKNYVDTTGNTVTVIEKYDTGWINRSDWTNVHLGTDTTKDTDSDVTHALNAPLGELDVHVLVSTDGTDANAFEMWAGMMLNTVSNRFGITIFQIDDNNIQIQTAGDGIAYINGAGVFVAIDSENWWYKIVVLKPLTGTITMTSAGAIAPTGQIIMYGGASAPIGYLLCNGASFLRTGAYATLFGIIGITYGSADGTHFNVPDMRGAFPRGAGTSTQFTQDHTTTLGTYEDDSMQGHWHTLFYEGFNLGTVGSTSMVRNSGRASTSADMVRAPVTDTVNGTPRTSNETRPNNLGLTFIIKT